MSLALNSSKPFEKPLILTLIVTFMMSILLSPFSANASSSAPTELSQEEINAISSGAYYNTQTELYEYNENVAIDNGAKEEHAQAMGEFLENMSKQDVKELNQTIGFSASETGDNDGGISTQAVPAVLIPIAAFLGGAAGTVIVTQVTLYGISKACQNLEGDYNFFDDFCEDRGFI